MNETKNFLAEIKARYPDCNILIPQSSVEQVSPFLSYSIAQVQADLSEESGDVFKVGSTKVGDSYVDQYSLSKPLLNKMAQAAGIVFDYSTMRTQFNADNPPTVVTCSIAGSMRRPDMTWRTEADSKTISVKDEEVKYRMEAEEKAKNGIADPRQAEAAAKLYEGQWFETTNRYNRRVKGFMVAEKDRPKYIDRYVKTNLAQLRKTWAEKAMTGAKLRVIRSLLGTKGTYTKAELEKPFVIPTVAFTPDYSNPMVQQLLLMQAMGGANSLFGMNSIQTTAVPAPEAAEVIDEGFVSDRTEEDEAREEYAGGREEYEPEPPRRNPAPAQPAPAAYQAPPAQQYYSGPTQDEGNFCAQCGAPITGKVREYSVRKFGEALCYECQRERRSQQ